MKFAQITDPNSSVAFEFRLVAETKEERKILKLFRNNYGRFVFLPKNISTNINDGIVFEVKIHPRETKMCDIFDYSGSGAC